MSPCAEIGPAVGGWYQTTQLCLYRFPVPLLLAGHAWLHRIAANACTDVLRRRRRAGAERWDRARHERPSPRAEDDPERAALGGEAQAAVQRALGALSPRHRQALVLREYAGLSCAEIGAILGCSRTAAKSALFRAREEFRRVYAGLEDGAAG